MSTADTTELVDYDEAVDRYDPVLGIEVHVELGTDTKMFDGAPNVFAAEPNTAITPVSLGLPGTLPVAELTRRLLPALRAAEGLAVFINSGAGIHSYGDNVIYAATKHALYALADGLRLGELGIRVSTVAPGPTDTPMLQGLQDYNPEHVIAPVEVAKAIRATVDAGPTTQLTEIRVRPRIELNQRK